MPITDAVESDYAYPETRTVDVVHTYGPVQLQDPFVWLEEKNDETEAWFREQNAFARDFIAGLPHRDALYARIKEIDEAKTVQIYSFGRRGDRFFHLKREIGEEVGSLYYRDGIDSESHLVFDPQEFIDSDMVHSIQYYSPSDSGELVAVGIAGGGSEIPDMYVVDVDTAEVLEGPIPRARSTASWLSDGSGFYYTQLRPQDPAESPAERYQRPPARFHRLGTDPAEDVVVMSYDHNPVPELQAVGAPYVFEVPETDLTGLYISHGVDRAASLYYTRDFDPENPDSAEWTNVCVRSDRIESADIHGGSVYLLSSKDAPRRKIIRLDLETNTREVILPESDKVVTGLSILGGRLYVNGMEGGVDYLMQMDLGEEEAEFQLIELPLIGRVTMLNNDYRQDDIYISLTSWTQAPAYYRYDPADGSVVMSSLRPLGPFDSPGGLLTERVMVKSHDGVEVPLTIMRHEDTVLDGSNPTILYGYGAYGISQRPAFGPIRLAWLERGGIFAVAHVRGGGEFGKEWHYGGHIETKRNSWLDFNASAEYLMEKNYTASPHIAAMGGSMGGVLVGRAMTSRPELYGAVVSSVGNHNPVRNHRRANGPANYPEYGNPLDPEEFPYVLAMDSYFAVKDGVDYPPMLLLSGYNDSRVDSWMPGKMAARLQQANPQGGPYLMRVEFEAGHGGVARSDIWEEQADEYAFLFWALGRDRPSDE